MRDQEIIGLQEAYASIYSQPQELSEEVEIAAQYFYEMGLNENGVDILIEELGIEEFAEFVYDIAEEYVLTEARAGGSKIEPKLASGKAIEGKPKAASLKSLRKKKAARKEAEENASAEKPSGMKASLKRQSAVAAAAKKQPKKPGLLDRVAGAVNRGIERHNAAMSAARETGKVIGKAAKGAGQVARGVASGASGAAKLAGHLATKGLSEEVEAWVNALVEEGYDLSEYTWEDMVEIYLSEASPRISRSMGRRAKQYRQDQEQAAHMERVKRHQENMKNDPEYRANHERLTQVHSRREDQKESFDLFDYLLEYLVAEGYADTNKAALAIMANMSEEWKQSIVEAPGEWFGGLRDKARASRAAQMQSSQPTPKPGPNVSSPFTKPASRGDSGNLTTYGAGGGAAAERAGQTRAQVMQQGAKNLENKKPVNQGPDFGR
jgi:hypothetical protein